MEEKKFTDQDVFNVTLILDQYLIPQMTKINSLLEGHYYDDWSVCFTKEQQRNLIIWATRARGALDYDLRNYADVRTYFITEHPAVIERIDKIISMYRDGKLAF